MTEQDEPRPLTRRERRLREMGQADPAAPERETQDSAAEAAESDDAGGSGRRRAAAPETPSASEPQTAPADSSAEETPLEEPEISPYDEEGRPRSRREMRELRQQWLDAQAEQQAEAVEQAEAAEQVEIEEQAEAARADEDAADAVSPEGGEADEAPTAEEASEAPVAEEASAVGETSAVEEVSEVPVAEEVPEAEVPPAPRPAVPVAPAPPEAAADLPTRDVPDAPAEETESAVDDSAPTEPFTLADLQEAAGDEHIEETPTVAFTPADLAEAETPGDEGPAEAGEDESVSPIAEAAMEEDVASDDVAADAADESDESGNGRSYSFPDIVPPEEWRSVLDDPVARGMATPAEGPAPAPKGDFDELISRAVAQEGSVNSGTSALILPSMPEGGEFSGPLGETGELFVTGSIELPKSLGETGGHSALHDSVESDAAEELGFEVEHTGEHDSGPVSARRAVSARAVESTPVVTDAGKERSKLPLILSLTGGGLLLGIAGVMVWGALNGMFG